MHGPFKARHATAQLQLVDDDVGSGDWVDGANEVGTRILGRIESVMQPGDITPLHSTDPSWDPSLYVFTSPPFLTTHKVKKQKGIVNFV